MLVLCIQVHGITVPYPRSTTPGSRESTGLSPAVCFAAAQKFIHFSGFECLSDSLLHSLAHAPPFLVSGCRTPGRQQHVERQGHYPGSARFNPLFNPDTRGPEPNKGPGQQSLDLRSVGSSLPGVEKYIKKMQASHSQRPHAADI